MILPGRRRVALENLAIAFPERSAAARRALCRASFRQLGMTLVEVAILLVADPTIMLSRVSVDGLEQLRQAAGNPGGVLVLTGHFGNWELLGLAHVLAGLPLAVVVRPLDSPLLNRLAERLRARTGAELIAKRRALPAVIDALRRGRMIGVLLDQNASRAEGVFVPFFGRPASTSRSLALLSLRTGRPIVPIFIHREPDGRHRIVVEAPLDRPATPSPEAVADLTAQCAARTEAIIRRWPEQWFWLHRRWRTRPPLSTTTVLLLAALTLSAAVALGAPAPALAPYRVAASRHETGAVAVRAYAERRLIAGPELPLRGAVVALMPFSDSFVAEVEKLKGHARESLEAYRAAAREIKRREEAYEKTVWEAGAPDLVLSSPVGPDGTAAFGGIAAGPWLLWARREVWNPVAQKRPKGQEKDLFVLGPRLVGFWATNYWMVPVTVSPGGAETVELTDRNIWFSGVIEERMRQDVR